MDGGAWKAAVHGVAEGQTRLSDFTFTFHFPALAGRFFTTEPSSKVKSESEVAQSCPTLSDPMDCSPPGSSVHGIFQARVLEWVAIAFSEIY